jgi:hypothetical protein
LKSRTCQCERDTLVRGDRVVGKESAERISGRDIDEIEKPAWIDALHSQPSRDRARELGPIQQ